jgi:two-component sensor histidine kinase
MRTTGDPAPSFSTDLDGLIDGPAAQFLDALMRNLPAGLTIARVPDVEIVRVSDAGAQLLQRPAEHLEKIDLAMHPEAFSISDPQTGRPADPESLPLSRATLAGEVVTGEEWLITDADGRKVPILCNAGPIRNDAGEIIGGLIAWADLTPQKQLEKELAAALAAKDVLMLELHHRVRNHIAIIASIIRNESRGCGDEALALAEHLGQRIMALADSYSALQADRIDSVPASELFESICLPLITKDISLRIDVSEEIEVSPQAVPIIGIIVNEAVCNAIKHAFTEDRDGAITVSLERGEDDYRLEVRDNGRGLSEKTSRSGGTGLITQLAETMGGTARLMPNDEGPGASIRVRLPAI